MSHFHKESLAGKDTLPAGRQARHPDLSGIKYRLKQMFAGLFKKSRFTVPTKSGYMFNILSDLPARSRRGAFVA